MFVRKYYLTIINHQKEMYLIKITNTKNVDLPDKSMAFIPSTSSEYITCPFDLLL